MKRDIIVSQLIKEGFSEKTLVNFNDKQLSDLHERIVVDADKLKTDPKLQALAKDPNTEVEVKEELKGNQKKLDKNHNGKIDGQDFKILKGQKQSEVKEADYKKEPKISRKDWKHFNADGEELKNEPRMKGGYSIDNEGKRHESRGNQEVKKPSEVKEWVKSLAEENFHNFTSKNEIMELINIKLNESEIQHGPNVKKGHNNVPEFMSYEAITASGPAVAPTKPSPTREPGTKPTPNKDPRKTPFRPGPGPNPKPKALKENKKSK